MTTVTLVILNYIVPRVFKAWESVKMSLRNTVISATRMSIKVPLTNVPFQLSPSSLLTQVQHNHGITVNCQI